MYVIEILELLESDGSRLFKEDVLEKHVNNELLKRVFRLTLDPYVNYGVAKVKTHPDDHNTSVDDSMLVTFLDLLEHNLATRMLSGNSAKDAVDVMMTMMSPRMHAWAKRLLLKNIRCGVSEKTVNKVWPDLVKRFEVMLAHVVDEIDHRPVNVSYPIRVEPKLDGLRLIAIKHHGEVTLYTRNGNVLETLPHIRAWLVSHPYDDFVLDGEVMGRDWNESNSVVMSSRREKDDSNMRYNVFDTMSYDEWTNQCSRTPLVERVKVVNDIIEVSPTKCVIQVPGIIAHNVDDVLTFYSHCLDFEYEGVMLKCCDAAYEFKRTKTVMKFKPTMTVEGTIVGTYTGHVGTKREGIFTGFEVMLQNGVVTRVGSGYSDAFKAQVIAEGPNTYVGKIVEVKCQPDPQTTDRLSKDGKARFPRFMRFRSQEDVDPRIVEAYESWKERRLFTSET